MPFLGRIPLAPEIVVDGDRGVPTVVAHPDSPQAEAFRAVAGNVAAQVGISALLCGGCNRPPEKS